MHKDAKNRRSEATNTFDSTETSSAESQQSETAVEYSQDRGQVQVSEALIAGDDAGEISIPIPITIPIPIPVDGCAETDKNIEATAKVINSTCGKSGIAFGQRRRRIPYVSQCRVVLVGIGADEQVG